MADPAPKSGRALVTARIVAAYVAAIGVARFADTRRFHGWRMWLDDAIQRALAGFPAAQVHADHVVWATSSVFLHQYFGALTLALVAIPVVAIARMIARARVRAGHADPLDRLRALVARSPRLAPAMATLPLLATSVLWTLRELRYSHWLSPWEVLPAIAVAALAEYAVARAGLRVALAPTIDGGEPSKVAIDAGEIVFDAVAVTRETKLAIAAVGAPSLPLVAWIASLSLPALFRDARPFWAFLAYAVFAAVAAIVFQKTSRVAVGIDGVYVHGTARTRFFAYRDLDEVRIVAGDLELVRKGRVALRLQLHGEDAARRDAVLARIAAAIMSAKDRRAAMAHRFVEGKSRDEVARVASGGGDYRAPSITREQLWQLVEGSTTDARSRTAAAEALVATIDPAERGRLRVAAERVAEPQLRVALERLADGEIDDDAPIAPRRGVVAP